MVFSEHVQQVNMDKLRPHTGPVVVVVVVVWP
jgi:hypothetical protein